MLLGHDSFAEEAADLEVGTSWHPMCCGDEAVERLSVAKRNEAITVPTRRAPGCIAEVIFRRYS